MFLFHDTIFPSDSVTLTNSSLLSGKKLPDKPKLPKVSTYVVARFRTYCTSWLNACCLSYWFNKSHLRRL